MISGGSRGPDPVNVNAWSRGSTAGGCRASTVAVGGPVVMRYSLWLVGDLGFVDRDSGWGYRFIKAGVIDGRVISPDRRFFMEVGGKGGVADWDVTAIGAVHGEPVLSLSCWRPPTLVVSSAIGLSTHSTPLGLETSRGAADWFSGWIDGKFLDGIVAASEAFWSTGERDDGASPLFCFSSCAVSVKFVFLEHRWKSYSRLYVSPNDLLSKWYDESVRSPPSEDPYTCMLSGVWMVTCADK